MNPRLLKKVKAEECVDDGNYLHKEAANLASVIELLKKTIAVLKSQLDEHERQLHDHESQLDRLRLQRNITGASKVVSNGIQHAKEGCKRTSAIHYDVVRSPTSMKCGAQLHIPAVNPNTSQPPKLEENSTETPINRVGRPNALFPIQYSDIGKPKRDVSHRPFAEQETFSLQDKGTKRKSDKKDQEDIMPLVCSKLSASTIQFQPSVHISSQHKRKLRSLVPNPVNDQLFLTSALDGVVNFWQVQAKGSNASLLSSVDCVSTKQRRWPEDIAWHPNGDSIYSVYTADGDDPQITILNLNSSQEKKVAYLEEKPHRKGIINRIVFMPWTDLCFATVGSDHAVVLWSKKDGVNSWKPETLHRNLHTSAVVGVAGMQQKQIVISAGLDKRIIGFDLVAGRADYKHQIESKCMNVLPNPTDLNLFMVQTGAPEKQLRLFDNRLSRPEIHAFGYKQENSESQSALINQAWSPDGMYITSGSPDPMIHIFDIRYNGHNPSQSLKAHQKRVLKAVWLSSVPLLVSVSSDLHIGLHKIS